MTMTVCYTCRKTNHAYADQCRHCGEPMTGDLPLFGMGGRDYPPFICWKCDYVNDPGATVCSECGGKLGG